VVRVAVVGYIIAHCWLPFLLWISETQNHLGRLQTYRYFNK